MPDDPHIRRAPAGIQVAEPLVITVTNDPIVESAIEIVDTRAGSRLVTAIELISKTNKRRRGGLPKYQQKQEEILSAGANLVEIDLLREGGRISVCPIDLIPQSHRTPYQVCVHRSSRPTEYEIYAISLRERLPAIRIPLRQSDPDAVLDLQAIIDLVYERAQYDFLDYTAEPVPRLDENDARWAAEQLRAAGKR
jgi:hypothetical protein